MGSLHLGPGAGGGGICSQSLPSHSHMSMHTLVQPRLRPSPAPSFAGVPLMELPEQSPMSSSLLTRINELALKKGEEDPLAEEDDIMPGTSMLAPPSARQEHSYAYAASAPASMLWGPAAHKPGGSAMGGRTPSKTLLEAMSGQAPPAPQM